MHIFLSLRQIRETVECDLPALAIPDHFEIGPCESAAPVSHAVRQAVALYRLGDGAANLVALDGRILAQLALPERAVLDAAAAVLHPAQAAHCE